MAVSTTLVSLLVSFYVYDLSSLYQLQWLEVPKTPQRLVNIHAGFDESSVLLKEKFPTTDLIIFDFYDPARHTEVSIRRARKAYPPHPDTQHIRTDRLPLPDQYADLMCVLFAAHEIRNAKERIQFFQELHRSLQSDGHVVVVEHLRDIFNFISYTIGVFHFFPEPTWRKTFILGGFRIRQRKKITPFVTCYVLEKDGTAP
ncbi:class I SAM-dependent methyltransferase [Catalinimonas alkaloidigena]|nr:methyltransferase domain-containing protein [Catalinimonas alkaloidigena]